MGAFRILLLCVVFFPFQAVAVNPAPVLPCTNGWRCVSGVLPLPNSVGDGTAQIMVMNPSTYTQRVKVAFISTGDFAFGSLLDLGLKLTSTMICNGNLSDASKLGNGTADQTCQNHANHGTILPNTAMVYAVSTKITSLLAATSSSMASWKIEVQCSGPGCSNPTQGHVTAQMTYTAAEGLAFVFVPAGGGAGTARNTWSYPILNGQSF